MWKQYLQLTTFILTAIHSKREQKMACLPLEFVTVVAVVPATWLVAWLWATAPPTPTRMCVECKRGTWHDRVNPKLFSTQTSLSHKSKIENEQPSYHKHTTSSDITVKRAVKYFEPVHEVTWMNASLCVAYTSSELDQPCGLACSIEVWFQWWETTEQK